MKRRLRHATFQYGYMWRFASVAPDSVTIVAFSGGRVMGWCLVFAHDPAPIANIFVNRRYRGRGVAHRLMREVLDRYAKILVVLHDKASGGFYGRMRRRYPNRITTIDWWKELPYWRRLIKKLKRAARARQS
ncbi:MAG: GNAT family N-acetyltransferase [Patescibacteria group bacterium]